MTNFERNEKIAFIKTVGFCVNGTDEAFAAASDAKIEWLYNKTMNYVEKCCEL